MLDIIISPKSFNLMPRSEEEEIAQNILLILLTEKFSVPLDRELGLRANILDAPLSSQAQLTAEIAKAIAEGEPRARLDNISFAKSDLLDGKLVPVVHVILV